MSRDPSAEAPFEPTVFYKLGTQEAVRPTLNSNEEIRAVCNTANVNNIRAFYKRNDAIESCSPIEYNPEANNSNETPFLCKAQDNAPISKAITNKTNETCEVVEIYQNMEQMDAIYL